MVNLNNVSPVAGESQTATVPSYGLNMTQGMASMTPESAEVAMAKQRLVAIQKLANLDKTLSFVEYEREQRLLEEEIAYCTPPLPESVFKDLVTKKERGVVTDVRLVSVNKTQAPRDKGTGEYIPTLAQQDSLRAAEKRYKESLASSEGQDAVRNTLASNLDNMTIQTCRLGFAKDADGFAVPGLEFKTSLGRKADMSYYESHFGQVMPEAPEAPAPEA